MGTPLGDVIRDARKARGLKQQEIAAAFNITRPAVGQWESGKAAPSRDKMAELADLLRIDLAAAMRGELVLIESSEDSTGEDRMERPAFNAIIPAEPDQIDSTAFMGPRNVPVLGTGSGGEGSDFRLNGQIVDHAPRPPGIATRRDVYVIYLDGSSIEPAYMDGSPIYVDPHQRPKPKDYVVVELWGETDDVAGPGYVKRLVDRRGGKLILEQHNPPKQLEPIPEEDVKRCHRVIPWPELLGI